MSLLLSNVWIPDSSEAAPTKFVPLSVCMSDRSPRPATNLDRDAMKAGVDKSEQISICMALVAKQM